MVTLKVTEDKMLSSEMIMDYKAEMEKVILASYPDIDKKKLSQIIDKKLKEKVKEIPVVNFENNYKGTKKKIMLIDWYRWYKKFKPITTEHGVCFKNHNEAINLSAKLLEYILNTRKFHKKKMFECKKAGDKEGEKYHNVRQKVFKIFANSYYGATGNTKSIFYNLFTALSITGKGQSLITNAATSFEMFFTDNIPFKDMNDLYLFINNVTSEKRTIKDSTCLSKQISQEKLVERLVSKLEDKNDRKKYKEEIASIVSKLSKKDINRLYYKNNLYKFCACPKVLDKIFEILDKVDSFKDPNEVPEVIKDDLAELWSWMKEFVFYNYTLFNHIPYCKGMTRKCVVTVDTDSNMINTEPWIDFLIKKGKGKYSKDDSETIYKMVNVMAYNLGNMIGEVHERYTAECNVPKEKREIINMKNEFLYRRMMLTNSKKNYAGQVWLQEGALVDKKDSLDIKGLTIKKSNVNKNIGNEMQDIMEQDILLSKNVNISTVLGKLSDMEKAIINSLKEGSLYYTKPDKANEPSTYKTPLQLQSVRGIIAWNEIYPDKEITYPAQVNTIKLKCNTIFDLDLEVLKKHCDSEEEAERIYNVLDDKIFKDVNMSKYGFNVISIPKTEKEIPRWIIPFIDYDTIVFDSLVNFNKILDSISVKSIGINADTQYYSNIIDF